MRLLFIISLLTNALSFGQDSTSVQLISRSLPDKVMLRWAVDQPHGWKIANQYGFSVKRSTISRNGKAVVPIERKTLTPQPLKPRPLEEWELLANQDQNIAVLAQALFGGTFETISPKTGVLGKITTVNDELEQRFTFALLAAEQSYEGAKLAGWGLTDTSVVPGERYVYKVTVALPEEATFKIEKATTYAGTDLYEKLPKPIGLAGVFNDSEALLSWNYGLLSNLYTNYIVEKSIDGITFKQQNKQPVFNATQEQNHDNMALYYTDSIPNNQLFYYRVKGKTAFGEISPPTDVVSGKATKSLGFVPRILLKKIPDDNTVILQWEFKEEGNELITGFELKRGNKADGPFVTVQKNLPPTARETVFKGLKRINYFTIVAMGKNGIESPSFSTIVQPVDSIPPAAPTGLKGLIDTTGVLTLNWTKNLEEDLGGYRIFKANNLKEEFSEVTNATLKEETFKDTVQIKNLNTKIYYKLQAEDQRYNRSPFSEIVAVALPDLTPPSPPVLKKYEILENGIQLEWIPSSSADVASHTIYRKNGTATEELWQTILETTTLKDTLFIDSENLKPNTYSYILVAKDSTGLESAPTTPILANYKGEIISKAALKFSGTVNRELRFINLSWRLKNTNILEYRLYKGITDSTLQLYKTFDADVKSFNDIALEINTNYRYGLQAVTKGGLISELEKIELKY